MRHTLFIAVFVVVGFWTLSVEAQESSSPDCVAMKKCCDGLVQNSQLKPKYEKKCEKILKKNNAKECSVVFNSIAEQLKTENAKVPQACVAVTGSCLEFQMTIEGKFDNVSGCNRDAIKVALNFVAIPSKDGPVITQGSGKVNWTLVTRCPQTLYAEQKGMNNPFPVKVTTVVDGDNYNVSLEAQDITHSLLTSGKPHFKGSSLAYILPQITVSGAGVSGKLSQFSVGKDVTALADYSAKFKTEVKNNAWYEGKWNIKLIKKGVWTKPVDPNSHLATCN